MLNARDWTIEDVTQLCFVQFIITSRTPVPWTKSFTICAFFSNINLVSHRPSFSPLSSSTPLLLVTSLRAYYQPSTSSPLQPPSTLFPSASLPGQVSYPTPHPSSMPSRPLSTIALSSLVNDLTPYHGTNGIICKNTHPRKELPQCSGIYFCFYAVHYRHRKNRNGSRVQGTCAYTAVSELARCVYRCL